MSAETQKSISLPAWVKNIILLTIAGTVTWLSYSIDTQETAFLFPRLMAGGLLFSVLIDLGMFFFTKKQDALKLELKYFKRISPGAFFMVSYVYFSESVGFYVISWIFLIVTVLFYSRSYQSISSKRLNQHVEKPMLFRYFLNDILFSAGFTLLLYLLFHVLLKVQTPRGFLI